LLPLGFFLGDHTHERPTGVIASVTQDGAICREL